MSATSWVAPGRGASVAQLLSAAIQISEPAAEHDAIRLVRHYRDLQGCTAPTSLALTGAVVEPYDVTRMAEAIRRITSGEDARDLAIAHAHTCPCSVLPEKADHESAERPSDRRDYGAAASGAGKPGAVPETSYVPGAAVTASNEGPAPAPGGGAQ